MFEKMKAEFMFNLVLKRKNIDKAYKMVPPTDSWYNTISTVHASLDTIRKLPHQTLQITSHDGLNLQAVYYPNNSNKTMIWVHGYTSHAERESAFPALFYRSLGFNVLIPYLRAHGPSEGKYISFGSLEPLDMGKWVDLINEMHPDGSIVFHGLSMGGGVVLNMAATEMKNVKCLVADAPTMSICGSFRDMAGMVFKKSRDRVLPFLFERFQKEFGVNAEDYDGARIVTNSIYPLLLSAGRNEHREEHFEQLRQKNPQETSVVILEGCDHGNGMYKQTQVYQSAIKEFIGKHIGI